MRHLVISTKFQKIPSQIAHFKNFKSFRFGIDHSYTSDLFAVNTQNKNGISANPCIILYAIHLDVGSRYISLLK